MRNSGHSDGLLKIIVLISEKVFILLKLFLLLLYMNNKHIQLFSTFQILISRIMDVY